MTPEEFYEAAKKIGLKLTDEQLKQFKIYSGFLREYNEHTNLTAIKDENDIYLKHFYDSLTIINNKIVNFNDIKNLIDVGTGAGFPGMVLKIAFPNIKVTLLDSNNKKTTFLKELATKLNVNNLEVINTRSEDYALKHLEEYDIVTSRAVANLRVLTELCLPMVKINGYFIPLKGNVEEELIESTKILSILHGNLIEDQQFNLPKEEAVRNILFIKKMDKTPKGFPRSYNLIKKGLK